MANFDHFAVLVNLCISFYKQYVNSPTTFVWYYGRFVLTLHYLCIHNNPKQFIFL